MPLLVRSFFDTLRQAQSESQDRAEVREQARQFRRLARDRGFAGLVGDLFPLGLRYERSRMEDKRLRPPSFADTLAERQLEAFQTPVEPSPAPAPPQQPEIALAPAPVETPPAPPLAPPVQEPIVAPQEPIIAQEPEPEPLTDPVERALQKVLETTGMTPQDYFGLSVEDRVTAINEVKSQPFPGESQSAFQLLINREQNVEPSFAPLGRIVLGAEQAGRELGAAATTGIRIAAEEVLPGEGRPSLEAVQEGGLTGAIERSIDVPVAPDVLNPLNLIPLPIIDPLVARALGVTFRAGQRITRSLLTRLGREAAEQATSETLDAGTRIALREFSEEVERASLLTPGEAAEVRGLTGARPPAAAELPTGLPGPARAVEPGAAPAVRQAAPAPPDPVTGEVQLAGGAPLTRAHLQERNAANAAQQAVQQGASAKPGRDAREAWRLFEGANKEAALHRATVKADGYDSFNDAAIKVVKDSDDQSDQVIGIMERMFAAGEERGPVRQFRPGERAPVQALYDRFDEATVRLIQADPDFEMVALPEYFAHQFKVRKTPRGPFARGLQLRPGFLRKRKLTGALGEILESRPDLDLVTWDPVAYVDRHVAAVDNYINSLEVIRGLKATGRIVPSGRGGQKLSEVVAKTQHGDLGSLVNRRVVAADRDNIGRVLSVSSDGTSAEVHFVNRETGAQATKSLPTTQLTILETTTGAVREGAPAAWRTPDIAPFKVRQALDGWVAHPDVALTLEQMFGKSAFDQFGALKLLKNVRESAFRVKVFGGLFQAIDYTFRDAGLGLSELARLRPGAAMRAWASPIKAVARAAVPGLDRKLTRLAGNNPKLKLLYRNGLSAGVDPSISDEAIRGIGGIVPETVGGKQIPGARGLQQVLDFMGGGAYEKFHKETLEQAGLVILEKNLKRGIPLEEAGRLAVEEVNVFFSSIPNWQSAVRSKTGRDLLKFPFFATGELEGWFRLPFQAPAGFAGIIGSTVIIAEMLQKLFTGEWLSLDQLNPYEVRGETTSFKEKLPIVGKGGFNATFLRPELPWKGPLGRTLYLDLLGQSDTPFRFALDPEFATTTRLGQFPRLGIDLAAVLHGDAPAFGEVVESPADAARFAFQQVSPIAVSGLAGTEVERIGVAGGGIQTSGLNIMAEGLRDVLARRFEDKFGREFNSEAPTDWELARTDPTLRPIVDQMQRFGLGSLTLSEEREATGRLGGVATEQAEQGFDAVQERIRRREFGDLSEDNQGRRAIWDRVGDIRTGRRAVFAAGSEAFPKETERAAGREPRTDVGRARRKMDDIFDRHPNLFTEEDWASFEADIERSLTTREQAIIERETGLGRHRLEDSWHDLNVGLEPYYEIPAEEDIGGLQPLRPLGQGNAREEWRKSHPQQDAQLWVLGRVGTVRSERAMNIAIRLGRRAFGQRVQPSRERGRFAPLQPLAPLGVP